MRCQFARRHHHYSRLLSNIHVTLQGELAATMSTQFLTTPFNRHSLWQECDHVYRQLHVSVKWLEWLLCILEQLAPHLGLEKGYSKVLCDFPCNARVLASPPPPPSPKKEDKFVSVSATNAHRKSRIITPLFFTFALRVGEWEITNLSCSTSPYKVKVKVKITLEQSTKAQRGVVV